MDFYKNEILEINASAFSGLPMLNKLVLKANHLITPPPLTFIRTSLNLLDMSQNNLTYIPKLYFDDCSELTVIYLGNNKLSTIPNLEFVAESIRAIHLNANHIADVTALYDNKYPRLKILLLNENNIREFCLPSRVFTPFLGLLTLSENQLMTIQMPKGFSNTILDLRDNPWHCDQSLSWIRQCFLSDNFVKCPRSVQLDFLTCDSPPNLQGISPLDVGKTCDVITQKCSPHYHPFGRGIDHSLVVSSHEIPGTLWGCYVFFGGSPYKQLRMAMVSDAMTLSWNHYRDSFNINMKCWQPPEPSATPKLASWQFVIANFAFWPRWYAHQLVEIQDFRDAISNGTIYYHSHHFSAPRPLGSDSI